MNNTQNNRAIIFDGDDTLWEIQVFYDEAKEQFFSLMQSQGFDRSIVKVTYSEIDKANVVTLGLSRQRFPTSMAQTYASLSAAEGRASDPSIVAAAYAIGASVFQRKPQPMEGVEDVLATLKDDYKLYLYSAGDPEIQAEKVRVVGLARYFNAIHIVERKSVVELQRIINEHNVSVESTWMVGNSIRSDINPALQAGLRCVWVHTHSWDLDTDVLRDGFVREVSSVLEIPHLLYILDSGGTFSGSNAALPADGAAAHLTQARSN